MAAKPNPAVKALRRIDYKKTGGVPSVRGVPQDAPQLKKGGKVCGSGAAKRG